MALPLALTACGGCLDAPEPWGLDEPAPPLPTVCDANREHIRGLGIVDEATMARRPSDEVVELHVDYGADGTLEGCGVYLFDEAHRKVVALDDFDALPGPQRLHWTVDFSPAGKPTLYRGDSDGDGGWDYEGATAFDEPGNYLWSTLDHGLDGIDVRAIFTHDDDGRRTRQEHDDGDDGVIDSFTDFSWSDDGRVERWDEDHDADGDWDRQLTWIRDTDRRTYVEVAGSDVMTFVEYLDDRGRTVATEVDRNTDGVLDGTSTTQWDGDTATTRHDFDADGITDNVEVHHWRRFDDTLRHGKIYDDYDNDGRWDAIRDHEYDAHGRAVHLEQIDPETGVPTYRLTYVAGVASDL